MWLIYYGVPQTKAAKKSIDFLFSHWIIHSVNEKIWRRLPLCEKRGPKFLILTIQCGHEILALGQSTITLKTNSFQSPELKKYKNI